MQMRKILAGCSAPILTACLPFAAMAQEAPSTLDTAIEATPPETSPKPHPGDAPTVFNADAYEWQDVGFGRQSFLMNQPSRSLKLLEIHVTEVEPGANSHAPHRHAYEEVIVLQSGRVEVEVNGVVEEIGPGSVMVFLSNDWHAIRNIGDEVAVYQVINVGWDGYNVE